MIRQNTNTPSGETPTSQSYRVVRSVWFFPAILVILLLTATLCKLNGSSVGVFYQNLYGATAKDPNLIANHPQAIRSDEWEVNTPFTMSQVRNHFKTTNPDIGKGEDVATVLDVPYKDWSTLFKPQNWLFFIAPLAYAFAFKWWLIGVLLMLGCYAFTLALLPGRRLLASLLSVGLFFSPFIQWWYQSTTILPIAYGLGIIALVVPMLRKGTSKKTNILLGSLLGYLVTCYILTLYVPFLIPVGLSIVAFLFGHWLNLYSSDHKGRKALLKQTLYVVIPAAIGLLLAAIFLADHSAVVQALSQSVYPGHRTVLSGHFSFKQFLNGYYNLQLQDNKRAIYYPLNQSEASNFILIFPLLLPLFAWIATRKHTNKTPRDWRLIALLAVTALFLIRLFVPFSEFFFNLIQLNRIPHDRLLIGFGMLNILYLVLAIEWLSKEGHRVSQRMIRGSTLFAWITVVWIGLATRTALPGYLGSRLKILTISTIIAAIVWLILRKHFTWALGLLLLFSFFSTARINPLYRGLGPLDTSKLVSTITTLGKSGGAWITTADGGGANFENLIPAAGLPSLSGVYAYPQLSIWQSIGKTPADTAVYNRYAHVFFSIEPVPTTTHPSAAYFDPPALDAFRIHADACSPLLAKNNISYILSATMLESSPCLQLVGEVTYPTMHFTIYRVSPSQQN